MPYNAHMQDAGKRQVSRSKIFSPKSPELRTPSSCKDQLKFP